tara:strand:- start:802 stop:945 length:144 start_codon:yes stop_codon:yes gene_type:complete
MSDALSQAKAFEAWGPENPDDRNAFVGDLAELISIVGRGFIEEALSK